MANGDMGDSQVIVFDNLVRPTDVIGEFKSVEAKVPVPFSTQNASVCLPDYNNYEDIAAAGERSGGRLMVMLEA
ncbi:hypothetical protein [Thiolapillus sp.]|uniref:hypothetical protein n=5 Tax=Thiolapillus sp. TaxID=2017437 RepID=UPI0025E7929D|nr:hypothetical protein [Thiolapillus sp.]